MIPKALKISDFTYHLPDDKIAKFPLENRDQSKLLLYRNGNIYHENFKNLPNILDQNHQLIFNQTKVVHARMYFQKETGSTIEIFCLEPHNSSVETALITQQTATWNCMVGNAKRWKNETLVLTQNNVEIKAQKISNTASNFVIKFNWQPAQLTFAQVLQKIGEIPLPPYLKRKPTDFDLSRYQTVFAKAEGSVAAPTAGLHFTKNTLNNLSKKHVDSVFVELHVGAGTFAPVKTDTMAQHQMHEEQIHIPLDTLQKFTLPKKRVAVGTTALRTIESLYHFGLNPQKFWNSQTKTFNIQQWDIYNQNANLSFEEAAKNLLLFAEKNDLKKISGKTAILIAPGYQLKSIYGLITNFHQPNSTLLLLVAAIVGSNWKKIYHEALTNNYRFLSYGDASFLIK